ncbi:hypothetical protein [Phyllobacterium endophyticum]|uniref:hypothetical protein n=1 Tax=Phyllobacterium endophyticum TaxID=1149773 RepID=UPI0011C7D0EB|nr:hypothetical protein [Phyllobacterium endophyticum]TXR49909.1 hypothetical protein FVA77_07805 [Phyllobacterium endophyticum]
MTIFKAGDIVTLDKTLTMNTVSWTSNPDNASFDVNYEVISVSDNILHLEGVRNGCLARRFKLRAVPVAPTKPPLVSLKLPSGIVESLVEKYLTETYGIEQKIKSMLTYSTGSTRVTFK